MEGFILAAGLGTRLRPLTNDRPKALVEVGGKTLLQHTIEKLQASGINHIVVNVHHFADSVVSFLRSHQWKCTIDVSDESSQLLDTGGGLKHAAPLFSGHDNVLVHNVDILSDIDLRDVESMHCRNGNLVTLCISRRPTKRMLEFDADGLLVGRTEEGFAFSGVSVVSPALFPLLPEADHPYPVIDEYIRLSHSHRIGSYQHSPDRWLDVGKPETLEQARQWIASSTK